MSEIAIKDNTELTPAIRIKSLVERKQTIQEVMKSLMVDGEHFGTIPGTKKQTLMKSGAELLTSVFSLAPKYLVTESNLENGHREYRVTAALYSESGKFVGEGLGSCSTLEKKYRYRNIRKFLSALPDDYKERKSYYASIGKTAFKDENGVWGFYENTISENPDIADTYNTVLKMAKKRALVDATLTATGASDIFTQDVEDLVEKEVSPKKEPQPQPKQEKSYDDAMLAAQSNEDLQSYAELDIVPPKSTVELVGTVASKEDTKLFFDSRRNKTDDFFTQYPGLELVMQTEGANKGKYLFQPLGTYAAIKK